MGVFVTCLLLAFLAPVEEPVSPFDALIQAAENALDAKSLKKAHQKIMEATERDPNARELWALKVRWAKAARDRDEQVYALHRLYHLAVTQKAPDAEIATIKKQLFDVDPLAEAIFDFKDLFAEKLLPLAAFYEEQGRPHSAIRINNAILTLAPERTDCQENIYRIAAVPDPSLADSAQDKDVLADVSDQWIRRFNRKHGDWGDKAKQETENYTTYTSAGYEVLVRTARTMEFVSLFFRNFFNFGTAEGKGTVPRVFINIYKDQEEFMKVTGAKEWSGGFWNGESINAFIGRSGFEGMLKGTLIHEMTHQFVSVATDARRTLWLNEGLATYFEGCRVLANGAVLMNFPANHYLFSLAGRMEKGWMEDRRDGIDPGDAFKIPEKAPTMEMVIQCSYGWAPAWYAPVWGVTYFFFNYQDPMDGRYVYRKNYKEYISKYGGRSGGGAIKKLEEMVLGRPEPATPGIVYLDGTEPIKLPRRIKDLNEVWKDVIVNLRDEESGKKKIPRPFDQWARYAVQRGDFDTAQEHFERGLQEHPDDPGMKIDFAKFLAGKRENYDRASKLMLQAIRIIESKDEVDEAALEEADALLARWDPRWKAFLEIHEALSNKSKELVQEYKKAKLPLMAMDLSWRLGTKLGVLDILPYYREGYRETGKSLSHWKLAYNETDLDGWLPSGRPEVFQPDGPELNTILDTYEADNYNYELLTMDSITTGDFSLEAEIYAEAGKVTFCGLLVGKKGVQNCQAVILFPARRSGSGPQQGFLDLASLYDDNTFDTHRHTPVKGKFPGWHKIRIDVTGQVVDVWFNDTFAMSHEFPNLSVVQGQFGLVTGRGEARYRNIRLLPRDPRDPIARIERAVRMEKLKAASLADGGGGSLNGSWMNTVPPWIDKVEWIQTPRTAWLEQGPRPTLLVFFSLQQNRQIPIEDYLNHLDKQYADAGLQIVSVASASDKKKIEAYLEDHTFPGSVGVDQFLETGYGHTFERFGLGKRFELPRFVLMDIDGKVVWEGDPGFQQGSDWKEGEVSYLDSPLEGLIVGKRLRTFHAWYEAWSNGGRAALREGRLEEASKLLLESQLFESRSHTLVKEAQRLLFGLQIALDDPEAAGRAFSEAESEPALETFLEWAELMEKEPDSKCLKKLRPILKGTRASDWSQALIQIKKTKRSWRKGKEIEQTEKLVKKLEPLDGLFPKRVKEALDKALAAQDTEDLVKVLEEAETIPSRWLAQEYFKW